MNDNYFDSKSFYKRDVFFDGGGGGDKYDEKYEELNDINYDCNDRDDNETYYYEAIKIGR